MAIKIFILLLLVIAITLFTVTVTFKKIKKEEYIKLPIATFINSTMYDINEKETKQIIQSKKVFHYTNLNKLYDATVVMRSNIDNNLSITDTIHAQYIEVTEDLLKFRGDVRYNRMNTTALYSESLDYDRKKMNLKGKQDFVAYHEGNKVKGSTIVIDKEKTIFTGKNNKPVIINIELGD